MKTTSPPTNWMFLIGGGVLLLIVGMWLGQLWPQRHPADPNLPPSVIEPGSSGSPLHPGSPGRACTMEAKVCPDGSAVGRTGPNCEFAPCPGEGKGTSDVSCTTKNLAILSPMSGQKVSFPLVVRGIVDNSSSPNCTWHVFEGQAASMVLYDSHDQVIGEGLLMAEGEWMTTDPISVRGTVTLNRNPTPGQSLTLLIREDDPSGLTEPQKIEVKVTY